MNISLKGSISLQRFLVMIWIAGLVVLVGIIATPINIGLLRALAAGFIVFLWLLAIVLVWHNRVAAGMLLCLGILVVAFGFLPGRPIDPGRLGNEYANQLKKYEGSRYIWGGENKLGIDCSGLIRRSMVNALFKTAWTTANPYAFRSFLDLWWHDCTAKALRDEYRGYTTGLSPSPSINAADEALLQPGDIAVTADGIHVLAYLGNQQWIEADPSFGEVIMVSIPSDNPWFGVPVQLMRWTSILTYGEESP